MQDLDLGAYSETSVTHWPRRRRVGQPGRDQQPARCRQRVGCRTCSNPSRNTSGLPVLFAGPAYLAYNDVSTVTCGTGRHGRQPSHVCAVTPSANIGTVHARVVEHCWSWSSPGIQPGWKHQRRPFCDQHDCVSARIILSSRASEYRLPGRSSPSSAAVSPALALFPEWSPATESIGWSDPYDSFTAIAIFHRVTRHCARADHLVTARHSVHVEALKSPSFVSDTRSALE